MRQHLFFCRKNRLTLSLTALFIVVIMAFYFIKSTHKVLIHCSSQINSVFGDNETYPTFSGIYTFMLDDGKGYISVNGIFHTQSDTYTVQKIIKISLHTVSYDQVFYDIKQASVQSLTGDNLPDTLYVRYILSPFTVIALDKTLHNSYLIRNLYSPVLVCNPMN
jgi:hypothetical protein